MGMRVAFFGSSLVSAYWNGAATYYQGLIRAFAKRGHQVTFYEPDAYERQAHRDMPDPDWARVIVYPAEQQAVEQALDDAQDADVIVKASGVGVFDEYLEAAVAGMRSTWRRGGFHARRRSSVPSTRPTSIGRPTYSASTTWHRLDTAGSITRSVSRST